MSKPGSKLPAEVYSSETVEKFLQTFTNSRRGRRNHLIFWLAYRAQLRCFEILAIRVSDIDLKRRSVTVRQGKGNKRRVVGLDAETVKRVDHWLAIRPNDSDYLFTSSRNRTLDTSYVRKLAARHSEKADISQRVHVHGFRHSGAVRMVESGVDLNVIRRQLGHASLAVTQRYIDHLTNEKAIEAVQDVEW